MGSDHPQPDEHAGPGTALSDTHDAGRRFNDVPMCHAAPLAGLGHSREHAHQSFLSRFATDVYAVHVVLVPFASTLYVY